MLRGFICFLLGCSLLMAKTLPQTQMGELTADKLERVGDEIFARGNVVLVNGDYYISAQDLKYNQKSKIAFIEDEARIYQGNNLLLSAKKLKLDFSADQFSLDSLYLQNNETGLWVSAAQTNSKEGVYYFKEGTISGCDIRTPIWHLDASSGSFDQNKNVLTLWNARAYLGKMPFLYIPYLSISTKDERKSGLLYPSVGYIDKEGFFYDQPLYIAPQEFWDMTLNGQIRTSRGWGVGGEFRLATPKNNLFILQSRYFYNFDSYIRREQAKNKHIYGFNMKFETNDGTGIFSSFPTLQDGAFIDLSYMNDIDYLRIDDADKKVEDRIKTSKVNYFFRSQDHYAGFYNRYFYDFTSLHDNRDTLQLLPSVQYHKFTDSLFWKNLIYSIDAQVNNATRPKGYNYVENSIFLPIGVEFPLFWDYVSLGVSTDLNFTNVSFYQSQDMQVPSGLLPSKNANFFTANYVASLTSDIARNYESFLHTMRFGLKVSGPYYRYNSSMFDDRIYLAYDSEVNALGEGEIYKLWNPRSIVDFDANKHILEASLSQYFYTPSGRVAFYYNVAQKLNLEFKKPKELFLISSMKNEIGSSPIDGLNLKGTFYYSFYHDAIEEASANIEFSKWKLNTSFGYYYKSLFIISDKEKIKYAKKVDANFLNFSLKNDFGYFGVEGDMNFDFIHKQVKDWTVTLSTDVRCFGLSLTYGQEFTPMITSDAIEPIKTIINHYVKFQVRVIPLGEVGASYRFKQPIKVKEKNAGI